MNFLFNLLVGFLIGFGAILPGVSSGVFCVVFGIYEKLVDSILNFFKNIKQNTAFLLPIGIGAFIGIVFFGNIIKYVFYNYQIQSCFAFIGLILGTIPSLFLEVSTDKCISIKKISPMFFSFIVGIFLIFLESKFNFNSFVLSISSNPSYLVFAGFIMSIGIVVPGVSNTILLMCLGVYSTYISAIADINFHILLPIGLGMLIGCLIWLRIINYLLHKYHTATFFSIIGFTLGSLFVLYPGFSFDITGIFSLFIFIVCLVSSYKISNYSTLEIK